ncbi:MAG: hypothetical protein FK730_14615 [Asgard group archaeon]|nr:hypothetical protein [Asgard group archaeon]
MFKEITFLVLNNLSFGCVPPWLLGIFIGAIVLGGLLLFGCVCCIGLLTFNHFRSSQPLKRRRRSSTKLEKSFSDWDSKQSTVSEDTDFVFCPFCGAKNTLPDYHNEKFINFFCRSCNRNIRDHIDVK